MLDSKPWYRSKSIWGGIVAVLAVLATGLGFELDGAAQADLVEAILQLVGVGGALLAVFGRVVATDLIE